MSNQCINVLYDTARVALYVNQRKSRELLLLWSVINSVEISSLINNFI